MFGRLREAGFWAASSRNGLLSTTSLLDRFEIAAHERVAIESRRRPDAIEIHHPSLGSAWIRDNGPINEMVL